MNSSLLFALAILSELVYLALFILTIKRPGFRFWPPPSWHSWQFFAAWLLALTVVLIALYLGLADHDSGPLPGFGVRWIAALLFFVPGCLLGGWAGLAFDLRATLGLGTELILRGPYRYTRNPQYISDSLNAIGYAILVNSWMVGVITLLGVLLNMLAPLTEEPWLDARYGEVYREYRRRVPRFFRIGISAKPNETER